MTCRLSGNHQDMSYRAALEFLMGRIDYERVLNVPYGIREFKLDRMGRLLGLLGDPQERIPAAHIAGTKGKGSTAAILSSVLTAAGHRTGRFTSPHLDRVEERFAVDGHICQPNEFAAQMAKLRPIVEAMDAYAAGPDDPDGHRPTYFEITTALAWLYFLVHRVDVAVLEVGLGGRLDSTNVCRPAVCLITSISLDHTQQLGTTLALIAREKAGIVKPGVPVVSGVIQDEPREVIRQVCRDVGAPLIESGIDFTFGYTPPRLADSPTACGALDYDDNRGNARRGWPLRLLGRHQAANAAVALAALEQLRQQGWDLPEEALRAGLAEATCPARVEVLAQRPTVVVDAAHNRASVEALVQTLGESFSPKRRRLVLAATVDKDLRGMLAVLLEAFDQIVLTGYTNNPRAADPARLAELAYELTGRRLPVVLDPIEAWEAVRAEATPDDLICVTGSFFIVAQLRCPILSALSDSKEVPQCPAP
ncbi:MAG: bifunctional folylpolyglutamate synthase/dihydrofolate synthase [Pirellulales bacterium]|nr:bifunctional folylpolyglutamate synthase/dihydrofolate synthase [Pirellulales bacterium]